MPKPYKKFYGKYRGKVVNNIDPLFLGRIMAEVAAVPGAPMNYAMPCSPYAGPEVGFYAIPPIDANVWIEYEGGDPNYPIWTGCFWGEGELPMGVPTELTKIFKTETVTMVLNDVPEVGGFMLKCMPPAVDDVLTMLFNAEGISLSCPIATIQMTPETITISVPEATVTLNSESLTMTTPPTTVSLDAATLSIEAPDTTIVSAIEITGNVEITGATEITGDLEVTGASELTGDVAITGATEMTGAVAVTGGMEVTGAILEDGMPVMIVP
jgi:Type VI secretion system/phage-baseplate injector OB domain